MPVLIRDQTMYRIGEALVTAGVSRATFFRWVRQGRVGDTRFKDRNGRRLFTREELEALRAFALRLVESTTPRTAR